MALVKRKSIFPQILNSFTHNIHKTYFPEKPGLSFISTARSGIAKEPRWYPESNNYAPMSDERQLTCQENLQIFVLGPSICGKERLIEYAANRSLGIPTLQNIVHAYKLNGFLLQGIEVEINIWHVGNMDNSVGIVQDFYQKYKTCFMLVYDVNDSSTFGKALQWISDLRNALRDDVPIVLVGYEDYEETLTSKLTCKQTPVSYTDGLKAKENYLLKTYYEFSDLTGPAVIEMILDAAHIALESKVTTPDSELAESEER